MRSTRDLLVEVAGLLNLLAQGIVPSNLREQATDLLVKVGNQLGTGEDD